jgi:hypothetical protein
MLFFNVHLLGSGGCAMKMVNRMRKNGKKIKRKNKEKYNILRKRKTFWVENEQKNIVFD